MGMIICRGQLVEDLWQWPPAEPPSAADPLAGGRVLLTLSQWLQHRDRARGAGCGVWLAPEEDPAMLLPDLPELSLITIHFPVFTDGRGYSQARLLRERHGYGGELRAVGDVLQDQLPLMLRCGFDAFCLRTDQSLAEALRRIAGEP